MIVATALLLGLQYAKPYASVLPPPTGKNGYEEYIAAAEILRTPEAGVYDALRPGAVPPESGPEKLLYARLSKLTPLQARREELTKYGRALTLVAQGNLKPVFDPRKDLKPETLFPEFAGFKRVVRFATRAASVYAADGQTGRAVDVLCDQLAFADNAGRGVMISNLVGAADMAIALAAFGDLLPRLSQPDAAKIGRTVGSILSRRPAAREVLPGEMAFAQSAINEAFAQKFDPKEILAELDEATEQEKRMAKEFAGMSPAARQALKATILRRLAERYAAMDRVFDRPESEWPKGLAELANEDGPIHDLGDLFLSVITPVFSGYATAAVRTRTQLRLLDLHSKIIQHRWEFGRLPESIQMVDPLSNEPYVYERLPDGTVRLASKGIKETGEIELRYKRPKSEAPGEKP